MKKGGLKPLRAGNVVSRAGKWRTKATGKALDDLEIKWGKDYLIVIKSWRDNCERLTTYFQYPQHIRRIIYTTYTKKAITASFARQPKTREYLSPTPPWKNLYISHLRESGRSVSSRSLTGAKQPSNWQSYSRTGSGSYPDNIFL